MFLGSHMENKSVRYCKRYDSQEICINRIDACLPKQMGIIPKRQSLCLYNEHVYSNRDLPP